jgi:hypothetical protein
VDALLLRPRQHFAQRLECCRVRVPNRHGLALFASAAQRQFELFADRHHFRHVIEERDIAEGRGNSKILRRIVSHRSGGGAAVDVKKITVAQHGHQFIHQHGVGGRLGTLMIVDAGGLRNILQKLIDQRRNFGRGHAGVKLPRFRRFVRHRLHRQMKHDLESAAMRFPGDVRGVLVIGQDRNGKGISQGEDRLRGRAVCAEIIDNDGQPRSAEIFRSCTGRRRCARHDFDFNCRRTCVSKLKMKKTSGLNRRILRQMISRRDAVKTPNQLCDRCAVRVCRGIILQYDTQVICVSGLIIGSTLTEFDSGPGRRSGRRRSRQIARDFVGLRRIEAVRFLLLATAAKNCEEDANSEQRKVY